MLLDLVFELVAGVIRAQCNFHELILLKVELSSSYKSEEPTRGPALGVKLNLRA
jgi:hypothetical protein